MGEARIQHQIIEDYPFENSLENPLAALTTLLNEDFTHVNDLIQQEMQSEIDLIPQLAAHLIQSGGKRIRPLLTLASAKLCGYKGTAHRHLAAAVEFIHTATLLHDDVVDESNLRRGLPSANSIWGNQASVLVGDFLFSRAFQMMVKSDSMPALQSLSNAAAVLAEGEVMQLVDVGNLEIFEQRYIDIITAKTATLFESACEVGGIISAASQDQIQALKTYGAALGICFQIIDDILDYDASIAILGKNTGDDLREKKITLPIIYTYHNATAAEKQRLDLIFDADYVVTDEDFKTVKNLINTHNALEYCRSKAALYGDKAIMCLALFSDSQQDSTESISELLKDLIYFTLNRKS